MSQNIDAQMVWHEGKLVPYEKAAVPLLSHTLHYGTGAFEGIRAYRTATGPAIFRAKEHLSRLVDSVKAFGGTLNHSVDELVEGVRQVVKANKFEECYIRPIAYLDDQTKGLKLPANPRFLVSIAAWNWGKYLGDDAQVKGIRVKTSSYRRGDIGSTLPAAKITGSYVNSVLARKEANDNGADEAILLDTQGYVAEGSGENIFLVKNGKLFTPNAQHILPGITRSSVFELAKHLNIQVAETGLTRNDLYLADELFFSGTAVEVTGIREIDGRLVGEGNPGPLTRKLAALFFKVTEGKEPQFAHWLTAV